MRPNDILAIVVSYNGGERTAATISELLKQVGHVHVVDNGSDVESRRELDKLERCERLSFTLLDSNRGVAFALNVGAMHALEHHYGWILTMDQDSKPDPKMIHEFCVAADGKRDLVCLTPQVVNYGQGVASDKTVASVAYAITSGLLLKSSIYREVGGYNEELFIDCVDFDYSLRLRSCGYTITKVPTALLHHRLGEKRTSGWFSKWYSHHSPLRRYYMFRNMCYMVMRYNREYPLFTCKFLIAHCILLSLIPIADDDPIRSCQYIGKGIRDYFSGVMGAMSVRRQRPVIVL